MKICTTKQEVVQVFKSYDDLGCKEEVSRNNAFMHSDFSKTLSEASSFCLQACCIRRFDSRVYFSFDLRYVNGRKTDLALIILNLRLFNPVCCYIVMMKLSCPDHCVRCAERRKMIP